MSQEKGLKSCSIVEIREAPGGGVGSGGLLYTLFEGRHDTLETDQSQRCISGEIFISINISHCW